MKTPKNYSFNFAVQQKKEKFHKVFGKFST